MADQALHTPSAPTPRTPPLPMPLSEERERVLVETLLERTPEMRLLLEDVAREANKYFPGHKGLRLELDRESDEWLTVWLSTDRSPEETEEREERFDEWFIRNNRRVGGRLVFVVDHI